MDKKDVISLVDLGFRFSKAKRLQDCGYQWLRKAPGRGAAKDGLVGNSLAVLKAIRAFNASNKKHIEVFSCQGYDGTPKKTLVIDKQEIIRLKGFIQRGSGRSGGSSKPVTSFKILGKVDIDKS